MNTQDPMQLLAIGEFAAATQLSPKALRIYDEQRILIPAYVDAVNGYRYYQRDQVASGRLIRILRNMELSLAEIGAIIAADRAQAVTLLRDCALEGERRFARQKRAFHSALILLGRRTSTDTPAIAQRERSSVTTVVRPFIADRHSLFARFQNEVAAARTGSVQAVGEAMCILVDPISEEEGRFEMLLPIVDSAKNVNSNIRQLPQASCAIWVTENLDTTALDITAALDGLFDWLDRRGHRAIESPMISFCARNGGYSAEISWAYIVAR